MGAALSSCGDAEPPGPVPAPAAPAAGVAPASANEPGPRDLLARLRAHVLAGRGGQAFNQDVAFLDGLLWPAREGPDLGASQAHVTLAHIAGDVGRTLALPPEQRAQVAEPDAISLEIHAAWLEAAALPPDDYRAWCADAGAALRLRLRLDRDRLFDPQRPGGRGSTDR
jgi:hypothetical protein